MVEEEEEVPQEEFQHHLEEMNAELEGEQQQQKSEPVCCGNFGKLNADFKGFLSFNGFYKNKLNFDLFSILNFSF